MTLSTTWISSAHLRRYISIKRPMDGDGVIKLYEPFPTPCQHDYAAIWFRSFWEHGGQRPLDAHVSGWPRNPNIPHKDNKYKNSGFPSCCADEAAENLEDLAATSVHTWQWQFERGKPRLGGLTVEENTARKDTAREEQTKRSGDTSLRRKNDLAYSEMKC